MDFENFKRDGHTLAHQIIDLDEHIQRIKELTQENNYFGLDIAFPYGKQAVRMSPDFINSESVIETYLHNAEMKLREMKNQFESIP